MKSFIQEGKVLEVVAADAIKSGDIVTIGSLNGVAIIDAAAGATATVLLSGVVTLNKKATEVWAQGDKLYIDAADATGQTVTHTAPGSVDPFGAAWLGALGADATGQVLLQNH